MNRKRLTAWTAAALVAGSTAVAAGVGREAPDPEGPLSETLSIRVELERNRLYAMQASGQVDTFKISTGSEHHPTPEGEFAIRRLIWNPSWNPPPSPWARDAKATPPGHPDNPMGRVKMLFKHPTYYIHGTNEPELVGHVTSHGCIRLRNEDAMRLARMVMEHGGEDRPESWFERVLAKVRSSEGVRLERAVPVTIVQGEPWPLLGEPLVAEEERDRGD